MGRKFLKRITIALLVIFTMSSLLVGCGGNKEKDSHATTSNVEQNNSQENKEESANTDKQQSTKNDDKTTSQEPALTEEEILENTLIQFNEAWIDYVNNSSMDIYNLIVKGSKVEDSINSFDKKGLTEKFLRIVVKDIYINGNVAFLKVYEKLEKTKDGKISIKEYDWIYELKKVDGQWLLVSYKKDAPESAKPASKPTAKVTKLKGLTNEGINETQVNYNEYVAVISPMYRGVNRSKLSAITFGSRTEGNSNLTFAVFGKIEDVKIIYSETIEEEELTEIASVDSLENTLVTVDTPLPFDMSVIIVKCRVLKGNGKYQNIQFQLDDMRDETCFQPILVSY